MLARLLQSVNLYSLSFPVSFGDSSSFYRVSPNLQKLLAAVKSWLLEEAPAIVLLFYSFTTGGRSRERLSENISVGKKTSCCAMKYTQVILNPKRGDWGWWCSIVMVLHGVLPVPHPRNLWESGGCHLLYHHWYIHCFYGLFVPLVKNYPYKLYAKQNIRLNYHILLKVTKRWLLVKSFVPKSASSPGEPLEENSQIWTQMFSLLLFPLLCFVFCVKHI